MFPVVVTQLLEEISQGFYYYPLQPVGGHKFVNPIKAYTVIGATCKKKKSGPTQ